MLVVGTPAVEVLVLSNLLIGGIIVGNACSNGHVAPVQLHVPAAVAAYHSTPYRVFVSPIGNRCSALVKHSNRLH